MERRSFIGKALGVLGGMAIGGSLVAQTKTYIKDVQTTRKNLILSFVPDYFFNNIQCPAVKSYNKEVLGFAYKMKYKVDRKRIVGKACITVEDNLYQEIDGGDYVNIPFIDRTTKSKISKEQLLVTLDQRRRLDAARLLYATANKMDFGRCKDYWDLCDKVQKHYNIPYDQIIGCNYGRDGLKDMVYFFEISSKLEDNYLMPINESPIQVICDDDEQTIFSDCKYIKECYYGLAILDNTTLIRVNRTWE